MDVAEWAGISPASEVDCLSPSLPPRCEPALRMSVQVLNDAFIAVPPVGCCSEARGTDRSLSFCNSHFDIRNCTASHARE
jgi:hypothetical protein